MKLDFRTNFVGMISDLGALDLAKSMSGWSGSEIWANFKEQVCRMQVYSREV